MKSSSYLFNASDIQAYTRIHSLMYQEETGEQEELNDLQCDEGAQEIYKDFTLVNFWLNKSFSYPIIAKNTIT